MNTIPVFAVVQRMNTYPWLNLIFFVCIVVLNYYEKKNNPYHLKIPTEIVTQLPSKYRAIILATSALLLCFT